MSDPIVVEQALRGPGATERFAAALARALRPPLLILLEGDLGAGKTTFVRGFVRALEGGSRVTVQSPTFALARTYATTPPVHHLDLYRFDQGSLADGRGLEELGLLDMLEDRGAISLVEWPRDLSLRGVPCARVRLSEKGKGRAVRAEIPAASVVDTAALPG
jgi:tRNA threonylcarbamoyladenosine biosynthesis protein TsaE